MVSNADSPNEITLSVDSNQVKQPLGRSIVALCILSVGGQLFSDISGTFFSTIIHFSNGLPFLVGGVINAVYLILGMVCYLVFGAISDNLRTRFGRRKPLIFIGNMATALLTFLFVMTTNFLWLFLDGGVLIAIANSMTKVSSSLTADVLPFEKRGRINTLLTVMTPIGSVIVWIPSLVTVIGSSGSFSGEGAVIEFDSIILAAIGLVTFMLIKEPPVNEPAGGWVHDLKKTLSWQALKQQKSFLKLFYAQLFMSAADNAIFLNFFTFISSINFNIADIAIFGPIAGAIIGVTIYFLGKAIDKVGRRKITIVGFVVATIGSWLIALSNNVIPILMFGFAIFFPFYWGGTTSVAAWQQDILPKEARGKFFGLIGITGAIGSGIGGIIASAIADKFGIFSIFITSAIFLWASLPIYSRVPETVVRVKK